MQAVVPTAGIGVEHRHPGIVVAREPAGGSGHPVRPACVARHREGPGAGIRQGCGLDGLLVEARPAVAGPGAASGREREVAGARFAFQQPAQHPQAAIDVPGAVGCRTGGDQRLGEGGVGVGQARFGPCPRAAGHRADGGLGLPQQPSRMALAGFGGGDLHRTERGEGHRARRAGCLRACQCEASGGLRANRRVGVLGGGGAERPQGATPAVVGGRLVHPGAGVIHAVGAASIRGDGCQHHVQGHSAEASGLGLVGVLGGEHQEAGVVVRAVAVLDAGRRQLGVFEEAVWAEQVEQMAVRNRGQVAHAAVPWRARHRSTWAE